MMNNKTKKQMRQSGLVSLVIGLAFFLGAIGFAYLDYRAQVKSYNVWERGTGLDLKTGKVDPNYQPPPFKFTYERMTYLPFIVIFGAVSLFVILLGASELRKSSKITETDGMRQIDARLEASANLPEAKSLRRQSSILSFLPLVLLIPVPFIAMYGLGAIVFAVYMLFVAVVIGASYFVVPRLMNKK